MTSTLTALIAEDNLVFALIIKEMIKQMGIKTVCEARTKGELFELATSKSPDIIISAAHLLKENRALSLPLINSINGIPILILTSREINVSTVIDNVDFIAKPFLFEDLEEKIKSLLSVYQ